MHALRPDGARALDLYVTAFSTRPTAIDLYLTQLVGIEALRLLKGNPTMTVNGSRERRCRQDAARPA